MGRILDVVKNAKTEKDVIKAIARIDRMTEKYRHAFILDKIKTLVKQVIGSEQIAIEYKEKVEEIVNRYNLTDKRRSTIDRITASKQFIARAKSEGKSVAMPKSVMKAIESLDKTSLASLSEADLINMLAEIQLYADLGKTKLRTRKEIYEMKKEKIKDELVANTNPIEQRAEITDPLGDLTVQEKLKNLITKVLNFFNAADKYISPADVIFDILDGSTGFVGSNYRLFKRNLDMKFGMFLDRKDSFQNPIRGYILKNKMETKQFNRIGIHAARMQEGGMEKLANLGMDEEYVDSIELTEEENELYTMMRAELDRLRPEIERIMRTVYNKPLGQVENYFSFMTDFDKLDDQDVIDRIVNAEELGAGETKTVKKKFTIARTGPGSQKIKINAVDIFMKHTENASYLVEMAEDIQMLKEVANSQEYREVAGGLGATMVNEWLDTMARKGGALGAEQIKWLDKMRVNLGAAVLGLKLTAALIQPTALFNGASVIGNYAFRGAADIANPEWRTFLKQFPELRDRMADDPSFLESGFKSLETLQRVGYTPLQKLDGITASAITAGAYRKYMEENGKTIDLSGEPDKAGMNYAETVLRRTQSSAFFKDVPLVLSRGKIGGRSLTKAILQFQNFLLNAWSLIRHEGIRRGIGQKRYSDAARIATWTSVSVLAATAIREGIRQAVNAATGDDDEEKEFSTRYLQEYLGYIPFVGQGMSVLNYGSFPVPVFTIFDDMNKAKTQLGGTKDATVAKGFVTAGAIAGKLFGIPGTVQAQQIATDFIDGQ